MSTGLFVMLQGVLLAYAVMAGVFLAFSDFIMRALVGTGRAGGIEAMQMINREVYRWMFMTMFLGLIPISLGIVIFGVKLLPMPAGGLVAGAGVTYLLGCFAITALMNVPMNNALSDMAYDSDETQAYWETTYVPRWSFWNSVRAIACVLSAVLMLAGLHWLPPM